MVTVMMDKAATVLEELGGGNTAVTTYKYRDLPAALTNVDEIVADYYYGQEKTRVKLLQQLGYSLKETIWYNDYAPYAKIRQVWAR
jgi:hypothetical protein